MTNPIDDVIRCRVTTKVLAEEPLPLTDISVSLQGLLELAGMAPFHRACDDIHRQKELCAIEPWRFHILDCEQCRSLSNQLPKENAGKIPSMLSAADALLLVTWLPNPPSAPLKDGHLFEASLGNMEHIAAASAAIQNLLLAATARGISNYWSSGGVLRGTEVFQLLEIPVAEILLGAIFLFPSEASPAQRVGSKLRDKRCVPSSWSRSVVVPGN